MSFIQVHNLTFAYDGSYDNVFENVSFRLDTDWKLGFIGRNGRGKTTFLKLLQGCYPYEGTITSSVNFDYFPFPISDESQVTIHIVEQVCPGYEFWMLCRELSYLHMDCEVLYRPYYTLSNGERTKILLAALFLKECNFLLIDEPTNHLDLHARKIVSDYLRSKKGFILVSHDRTFLDQCVDHILTINKTSIRIEKGNFSTWQQNKDYQDQFELVEKEKLKKEIRRLTDATHRTTGWSDEIEKTKRGTRTAGLRPDRGYIGHQAAKMMKHAKVTEARRERAMEEKSKLLKDVETADPLKLSPLTQRNKRLISCQELSVAYDDKTVFDRVSFSLYSGDRISIQGKNGCGKSTLLDLITGKREGSIVKNGSLTLDSKLVLSHVPQNTSFLTGDLKKFASSRKIEESLFKSILRKLDFERVQFEKDMADLSEGQRKRCSLPQASVKEPIYTCGMSP